MGFLDNSSDIIIDALITDLGRKRLAQGDGSFKIVKFALGDDEIDYSLYNKNDTRGSSYFDLDILQTPVLEAFTNNESSMHSKLMTINRNNILYLPVLKINSETTKFNSSGIIDSGYVVAVDTDTETGLSTDISLNGVLKGQSTATSNQIRIDQGLDTSEIKPSSRLSPDLIETQYIVEMDNRFGTILAKDETVAVPSFIDDDDIATYYFSLGTDSKFVNQNPNAANDTATGEIIAGPRGTILEFKVKTSLDLVNGSYLFDTLGSTSTSPNSSYKQIYSNIRVTGVTTGYSMNIPVVFMKSI